MFYLQSGGSCRGVVSAGALVGTRWASIVLSPGGRPCAFGLLGGRRLLRGRLALPALQCLHEVG
eukprot:6278117-Pyramimonas_sp.AAC.1